MDTFDARTITAPDTTPDSFEDTAAEIKEKAETVAEEAAEVVGKVNWWRIAGYAAAGVAFAGALGLYMRQRAQKPKTRLERLKEQLGLAEVDFRHLRSTIDRFDFDKLNESRRKAGTYAKKATHQGAKKIAELTR